jgi:uncharacterized membrane protein YeaQ/YmgE (transglycosylase-associated protein family)
VELLFAVLGGMICGLIAHVIMPWRSTRGILVGPAVGGIVAAIAWEACTWAGWKYADTWIWVVALVGAGIVALAVEWALGPRRDHADVRFFSTVRASGKA